MAQVSPAKIKVPHLHQVALVVKDLQKTMENYWNILGIGAWDPMRCTPCGKVKGGIIGS
ncbi:hypothetical protein ES703_64093 [subsurface metagenome]